VNQIPCFMIEFFSLVDMLDHVVCSIDSLSLVLCFILLLRRIPYFCSCLMQTNNFFFHSTINQKGHDMRKNVAGGTSVFPKLLNPRTYNIQLLLESKSLN